MKKILTTLIMVLLASNVYAHDDGSFYVIPTGKVIIKEMCNGTPVGSNAFVLDTVSRVSMHSGDVYSTVTGYLVEITGLSNPNSQWNSVYYAPGESFRVAPSTLPQPDLGVKGPYYYLNNGGIAYARYL